MKRNQILSMALAFVLFVPAIAQDPSAVVAPVATVVESQTKGPDKLPAENIDGSKVNSKTQAAAAEIIKGFNREKDDDLMGAATTALEKFEALHQADNKNLSVMTWVGYLSSVTGNHARAIEVLTAIKGSSKVDSVNHQNLRNLAASFYLTQNYSGAASTLEELNQLVPNQGDTLALLGSSYVLGKEYTRAIAPLEQAKVLLANDQASVRNLNVDLGICFARTGEDAKAMSVFDSMMSDEGLTSVQLGWMGFVYLNNDRFDSAIMALERSYALDSTSEGVMNNLANAYLNRGKEGDEAKAIALFDKLAATSGTNPVADYNVGSLYLSQGEFAKAKPFLMRAAESGDPFALNNLGRACEGLGEDAAAAASYSKASDADRSNLTYARNAGFALLRVKNDRSAVTYLERAAGIERSADVMTALAGAYDRMGMPEKAMPIWMSPEVRDVMQNDSGYWQMVGRAHAAAGQSTEAEAAYRKSLQIEPNNADVINNLGVLLYNGGNYEGALDCFKKQASLQPDNVDAQLNVAAAHVKLNQITAAIDIWRGVVRTNPDRMDVRLDLADGLWNTGDTPGARFHYAYVHRKQSTNARALNGLGMWALLQTQHDEAESFFRQSVRSDRKFIPAYQNLAIVLERKNKVAEAIKVLESALAMDKNNAGVQNQLARLKN
jgi:tetratricopeptide (TPR) repeat protein